jgi:hypothetical protein
MSTKFSYCMQHLTKEAEEGSGKNYLNALKHVGVGLLGLGAGTAVGKGAGHLLGKLDRTSPVPGARVAKWLGPAAGAGLGLSYSLWKQREKEEIDRALKHQHSSSQPGVPGK